MNNYSKSRGIEFDKISWNKKKLLMGIMICLLLILVSVYFFSKTATAQQATEKVKLVASVEVNSGDTLWGIAEKFMTDEYDNINEYILEIKRSNGLSTDTIHAGHYLIVPYYAEVDK